MIRRIFFFGVVSLQVTTLAFAQAAGTAAPKARNARAESIEQMVQLAIATARQTLTVPITTPFGNVVAEERLMAMYLIAAQHDSTPASDAGKLIDALLQRADKQLGATSSSTASTTIASKGLVPQVLGIAVESGAINRDVKGSTFTFQITPMGVVKALQGKGLLDVYADYSTSPAAHFASRFAVSASFDTSRGTPGTFTAEGNQLSAWSVRAKLVDGRDPAQYAGLWDALLAGDSSKAFTQAATDAAAVFGQWPEFAAWHTGLKTRAAEVDKEYSTSKDLEKSVRDFRTALNEALPKLAALTRPAAVAKALDGYVQALAKLQADIDVIYDFAAKGQVLTAEWLTTRDKTLPDLYTATGIYAVGLGKARKTDFTLNAAASFYRSKPEGVDHTFKTFDLNVQLDHPLGKVLSAKALLFTIAGRYSYLPNDTVAPGPGGGTSVATTASPALKGHIGVLQFKFTLPLTTGVKIPLSITTSNRTELIKEKDVRASFGLTFDLDSVLGIVGVK